MGDSVSGVYSMKQDRKKPRNKLSPVSYLKSRNPQAIPVPEAAIWWLDAGGPLFQDAAQTTVASANNDPAGSWVDKSASGRNVTQSTTGFKPTLKTGIVNGNPVVRFDGSDDVLNAAGVIFEGLGDFDFFMVCNISDATNFARIISEETTGAGNRIYTLGLDSASPRKLRMIQDNVAGDGASWNEDASSIGSFRLYEWRQDSDSSADTNIVTDGTIEAQTKAGSIGSLKSGIAARVSVGAIATTGGLPITADIAEIILYNRLLTGTELQELEDYFANKYGLIIA